MKTNQKHYIVLLIAIIPFLSDWTIVGINPGDLLLLLSTIFLVKKYHFRVSNLSIKFFSYTLIFLFFHLTYHSLVTSNFNLIKGVYFTLKIIVYMLFTIYINQLLSDYDLKSTLLKKMALISTSVIIVGIVINILLLLDFKVIPNLIWSFTRSDMASYTFRGSNIIRMKSLFSEPSYLGVYLNFVIAVLYLGNTRFDNFKYLPILIFGSLMTFSFSSIICTILFLFLIYIKNRKMITISKKIKRVIIIVLLIAIFVFREQLYLTIIFRFIQIIKGVDNSALQRIFSSWSYISKQSIIFGNGIGMTPAIWNNLSYILSDFGLIIFIPVCLVLWRTFKENPYLTVSFIIICFLKGGYLSSQHIIYIALLFSFSYSRKKLPVPTRNTDIQVLISTMNLMDNCLFDRMNVTRPFLCMNQITNKNFSYLENVVSEQTGIISMVEKGVGLSRNTLLHRSESMISVLADDDLVFENNFRSIISKKFEQLPDAEMLIFNLKDSQGRFETRNDFIVNNTNFMRFGAARLVFRTDSVRKNNINFNLLFGGGTHFSSGEDTLFIKDCIKKGMKIYAVTESIATLTEDRESSWFTGYNAKYFEDKGTLFFALSKNVYILNIIQFTVRKKHLFEGNITYLELFRIMMRGASKYNNYSQERL